MYHDLISNTVPYVGSTIKENLSRDYAGQTVEQKSQ